MFLTNVHELVITIKSVHIYMFPWYQSRAQHKQNISDKIYPMVISTNSIFVSRVSTSFWTPSCILWTNPHTCLCTTTFLWFKVLYIQLMATLNTHFLWFVPLKCRFVKLQFLTQRFWGFDCKSVRSTEEKMKCFIILSVGKNADTITDTRHKTLDVANIMNVKWK